MWVMDSGKHGIFLWESFTEQFGVMDENAWKWIREIVRDEPILMFFNPEDEVHAFKFDNASDVEAILAETFGFEFYLTNKATEYVLCFNHHNVLIACGKAIEWLKELKKIKHLNH
jgi:hypothetical protein